MKKNTHILQYISNTKFIRSFLLQALSVFVGVSIAIVVVAFFAFTSEISDGIVAEKKNQLTAMDNTMSRRMDEATSIAYNISIDPQIFMEPVEGEQYTGYEMSTILSRYLIGNDFIQYLAYYRLSEPDILYTSKGELSFRDFWNVYLDFEGFTEEEYRSLITATTSTQVIPSVQDETCLNFTYVSALPQFSANPQAFIIMLIPLDEVKPLMEMQLMNAKGVVGLFDANGNEIYCYSNSQKVISIDSTLLENDTKEEVMVDGTKYVFQKQVSDVNGWTSFSLIERDDMISGLANRQILFITLLLFLMFVAVFIMIICVAIQFKPISDKQQKLEKAYYEAEAANKAKTAFFSSMSHDIRTPMNAIIGMTSMAGVNSDNPEYVKECLKNIQVSSKYLLDIINNVLDMSRIESGKFTLNEEVIHIPDMISSLVTILGQSVEAKEQKFIVECEQLANHTVIGDRVRLTQVFVNILSNAVKFTPNGGTIRMQIKQEKIVDSDNGKYIFRISDTGIGMSKEFVGQVFEAFTRARDEKVGKVEGTGLGMAITRDLVELMGGTIECESNLGKGTTFTVTALLKLAEVPEEILSEEVQELDFEGKMILVADDNDMNREIVRVLLHKLKAEIVQASNGKEAVQAYAQHPAGYFDAVLMDIQMPLMNGYDATVEIRSMDKEDAKSIPIYAMTASTFDEDVRKVIDAGMNGHIGKPFTPDALYQVLKQAIYS